MRVVHSFVDKYNVVWKELLYSQYLSAVLAKKHYGNITFVSTQKIINQIKKIGIPYDSFVDDIVKLDDFSTWSIPKIKVFKSFNEPFLHIDNDTFIFDKIDFKSFNKPFLFSHPDTGIKTFGSGLDTDFSKLINSFYTPGKDKKDYYYDLNNTYTRLFLKLISSVDSNVIKNFNLGSIPNMNIVYVEDYETFNKASSLTLSHYYSNKDAIDSEEYGPCYIEQLTLHQILRSISKEYRKYSSKYKHTVFKKLPFSQIDKHNNVPNIDDVAFPFRGKLVTKCKCCNKSKSSKVIIEDRESILEFLDFDFNGFLHTTYFKWYDIFQAYTIHQLRKHTDDNSVKEVYKYFKEIYPRFKLPIKSGGEKLYEELTGFSFE